MVGKQKKLRPPQWALLKKDHPRHFWALEQVFPTAPLAQRVTKSLATGQCSRGDLDLLWEIANELELYGRLDVSTAPPEVGTPVQETFEVNTKDLTYNAHGDQIYRVLLQHSDGWWARLELRPDGATCRDFQQDKKSHVTIQSTIQRISSGMAVLGGLLRRSLE